MPRTFRFVLNGQNTSLIMNAVHLQVFRTRPNAIVSPGLNHALSRAV